MSGLQRTAAIVGMYNQLDTLTDSGIVGSAGLLGAGLSFRGALESDSYTINSYLSNKYLDYGQVSLVIPAFRLRRVAANDASHALATNGVAA